MKSAVTLLLVLSIAAIFAVNSVNGDWHDDVQAVIDFLAPKYESHYGLAVDLINQFETARGYDSWVVIVYDDVYGGSKHTWKGYPDNVHVSFRNGGHNIVVGRIPYGTGAAPSDTRGALTSAITTAPETCVKTGWWNLSERCYYDSEKTNFDTWDKLVEQGKVTPLMLHVASRNNPDVNLERSVGVTDYITYGPAGNYYVTLLAKAK